MQIINFTGGHMAQAQSLALSAYREEQAAVPFLPMAESVPDLAEFAGNRLGVAAVEGDRVLGFLCCHLPFENVFGSTDVRGVFSPMGANAAVKENRTKIYGAMYQAAATKWAKAGAASHAICLYAHDEDLQRQFYRYGFGLRCVDALRPMTDILAPQKGPYEIGPVKKSQAHCLRPLRRLLRAHLGQSPCFMVSSPEMTEALLPGLETQTTHAFACFVQNTPIAFIDVTNGGETFVAASEGVKNICGAFCLPEHRGKGVMQSLLSYAIATLRAEGYALLGVDFESINPVAYQFWSKYFTAYTHGVVRRIDERSVSLM